MTLLLSVVVVVLVLVAATLRCLWWFWTMHEQDVQRERIRQRSQGVDADILKWRPVRERYRERGK